MSKKFYSQKDALGFPIPGTMMSADKVPAVANILEINEELSLPTHPSGLKYNIRVDKKGSIVPNSLFQTIKVPVGTGVLNLQGAAPVTPPSSGGNSKVWSVRYSTQQSSVIGNSAGIISVYTTLGTTELVQGQPLYTNDNRTTLLSSGYIADSNSAFYFRVTDGVIASGPITKGALSVKVGGNSISAPVSCEVAYPNAQVNLEGGTTFKTALYLHEEFSAVNSAFQPQTQITISGYDPINGWEQRIFVIDASGTRAVGVDPMSQGPTNAQACLLYFTANMYMGNCDTPMQTNTVVTVPGNGMPLTIGGFYKNSFGQVYQILSTSNVSETYMPLDFNTLTYFETCAAAFV